MKFAALAVGCLLLHELAAQAEPTDDRTVLDRSLQSYDKGDYRAAIALLEPLFADHYVHLDYHSDLRSTEQLLATLYERAGQIEHGVDYLHAIYLQKIKGTTDRPQLYASLEEQLFDLAILARKFDIAAEVLAGCRQREDYPGWDLDSARLHAARGEDDAALADLASYFAYAFADSRSRVMVRREFVPLHGNDAFRRLMTDTRELEAARRARERTAWGDDDAKTEGTLTFADYRAAIDTFRKVTTPDDAKTLAQELRKSHELVAPNVARFRNETLELLCSEKGSVGLRVALAIYLVGLMDPAITPRVAREMKDDTLTAFPQQLFQLAYATALVDPDAARPFLLQMLPGIQATIYLTDHAMSVAGDGLLFQAFGAVELQYLDDLLRIADAAASPRRDNATALLLGFGEPRLLPILRHRFAATTDAAERVDLLGQIAALRLPAAKQALVTLLSGDSTTPAERRAIVALLADLAPPEPPVARDPKLAITDDALRDIFFANLAITHGEDLDFVEPTMWATARPADIPHLRAIRAAIFARFSDEAFSDWDSVTKLIAWLRWQ